MENLIKRLRNTSSTNEKISILTEHKENKKIQEAFRLCYDPFILSWVKKISPVASNFEGDFEFTFAEFQLVFDILTNRKITGNAAQELIENFLSHCAEETQDIYIRVLQKDMKCGVSSATLKEIWGDNFLKEFNI